MNKIKVKLKTGQEFFTTKTELNFFDWGISIITSKETEDLTSRVIKLTIAYENVEYIEEPIG